MLADQNPRRLSFKADLASLYGEQGAAPARFGQDDPAEKAFNQALNFSRTVLASDPEDAAQRLVTAGASEGLAALAHKRGKQADADRFWRLALEIRMELALLETRSVPAQAALAVAGTLGPWGRGAAESRGTSQNQRGSTGRAGSAGAVLCGVRDRRHH